MQLQKLQSQIQEHAQAARALLVPESLISTEAKWIERKAELGEWRQIVMQLERSANCSLFAPQLLQELLLAREAMNFHDSIVAEEILERTSNRDRQIIGECLRALVDGPFIPEDDELHTVTGVSRRELGLVAKAWPDIRKEQSDWKPNYELLNFISLSAHAVGQTLNNLTGYPHGKEREWPDYISVSKQEVAMVCGRWFELRKQIVNS